MLVIKSTHEQRCELHGMCCTGRKVWISQGVHLERNREKRKKLPVEKGRNDTCEHIAGEVPARKSCQADVPKADCQDRDKAWAIQFAIREVMHVPNIKVSTDPSFVYSYIQGSLFIRIDTMVVAALKLCVSKMMVIESRKGVRPWMEPQRKHERPMLGGRAMGVGAERF